MRRPRLVHGVLSLLGVLILTSAAYAWLSGAASGSGTGNVTATVGSVSIQAATAPTQALLPTGTATGDVKATIVNPSSSSVHIGSLSSDGSQGSGGFSSNASACALSFTTQTNGGAGWTVSAGSQLTIDLTRSLTMGTAAAGSCQGQTFTVYLKTP